MKFLAALTALFSRRKLGIEFADLEPVAANLVPLRPVLDQRIQSLRKIAALRLARKPVPLNLFDCLSESRIEWIRTLDVQMLLLLSNASQHRIREHLAGRRAIRGLLAADPVSVKAYRDAMKPRPPVIDHEDRQSGGGGGGPRLGK